MRKLFSVLLAVVALGFATPALAGGQTFTYTGSNQTFTVPAGVYSINVKAWGAGGDLGYADFGSVGCEWQPGGGAGFASGVVAVTPGTVITVRVGGATADGLTGGWPNGGTADDHYWDGFSFSGAGGGSSSVLVTGQVALEAAGGNGSTGCTDPVAGGGIRTCSPFGNQRGNDGGEYVAAGGGGYCPGVGAWYMGLDPVPASSYVPTGGTEQAGAANEPGNADDPARGDAGQGGVDWYTWPTNGRVIFAW